MIYLFTTASGDLYKRDLLNACSFPSDSYLQFGYRRKHIPDDVHHTAGAQLAPIPDGLQKRRRPAIIIYAEWFPDRGDLVYRYHPVRKVAIEAATLDAAGNLSLTLRLAELFRYRSAEDDNNAVIDELQSIVNGMTDRPYTLKSERAQPDRRQRFICLDGADWRPDLFDGGWEALVAHMGRLTTLQDCYFLRLTDRSRAKGELPMPNWDCDRCRPEWRVEGGKSYELAMRMQLGEKAASNVSPALLLRDEVVTAIGPFTRQLSGGIEVDFLLDVRPAFQTERTTIRLRVSPTPEGATQSAEIQGILLVAASRRLLVLAIVLLAFGSLLQGVVPMPDILQAKWGWTAFWATAAFFGSKAIGTVLLAVGAFLGFRKLPFKLS